MRRCALALGRQSYYMIEELTEAFPQIVTGVFGLLAAVVGYFVGKQSKIDDVRIKKTHEFAEELSVLMQEDYRDRKFAREQYDRSFGHLDGPQEAAHYFGKHDNLHSSLREVMQRLIERRPKIVEVKDRSAIYLPERVTDLVDEYIGLTTFEYMTDGIGLIDTFAQSFFAHSLDDQKALRRKTIFDEVMRRLRKVK